MGTSGVESPTWILFRGTDQIGQYDLENEVYRRVNTDHTFSDPAPRPWRTHPNLIPQPPPLVAKQQAKAKELLARAAETPAHSSDKSTPEESSPQTPSAISGTQVEKMIRKMPNWSLYAAGGGLAGLALALGLVAQARRQ